MNRHSVIPPGLMVPELPVLATRVPLWHGRCFSRSSLERSRSRSLGTPGSDASPVVAGFGGPGLCRRLGPRRNWLQRESKNCRTVNLSSLSHLTCDARPPRATAGFSRLKGSVGLPPSGQPSPLLLRAAPRVEAVVSVVLLERRKLRLLYFDNRTGRRVNPGCACRRLYPVRRKFNQHRPSP